ncbi:MAG TPA: hypothetical protein PK093_24755 [Phycisphaerae bacterium]|nr:hypothetical protein [Phycisphaerae bacterium]
MDATSSGHNRSRLRRFCLGGLSLALAAAIWLPSVHLCFRPDLSSYRPADGVGPKARLMANRQVSFWSDADRRRRELRGMRSANPEWDFMGRTFFVLALANMIERDPSLRGEYLPLMDAIIDETLDVERTDGMFHFLMPYAKNAPFRRQPARSLFVDGEIALMLGARRLIQDDETYRRAMRERIDIILSQMRNGPMLCAESYPDECWTFCNTMALAAIRIGDYLDQTDHSDFFARWIATARKKLVHPETGLLVSEFDLDGDWHDGPEGSSIWMIAHCLQLVDADFARDQYERARKELDQSRLGFGGASEWPGSWRGPMDVDSGPTVPLLNFNAGSSGLAFIGAAAFDDDEFLTRLLTSVSFAGLPSESDGELRYLAGNQVGDAVLLYSLVLGPLWDRVTAEAGGQ